MKKLWLLLLLSLSVQTGLTEHLSPLQTEFKESLALRFTHDQFQNLMMSYQQELHNTQQQLNRTERLMEREKNSAPAGLAVYTLPFQLIPPQVFHQALRSYADNITVTKIQRPQRTEVIFHFPPLDKNISNAFSRYHLMAPKITVTSVLLSNGQALTVNKVISSNVGEQSLSLPTKDATILKINLTLDYQIPENVQSFTLTKLDPIKDGVRWMPSADHVVVLELNEPIANEIIYIDGQNSAGKTLAAEQNDRINNPNEIAILKARIALYRGLLEAVNAKTVRNNQEALDHLVTHAENLLMLQSDPRRELVRVFSHPISTVTVYKVGNAMDKQYNFALY